MADEQPPEARKLPFDEEILQRFRRLSHQCLTDFPELRSVSAVFDWAGNLNEAPIKAGMWQGEGGAVMSAAAIIGIVQQTLKVLHQQIARGEQLETSMREELTVIGQELIKKRQELGLLEAEPQPTDTTSESPPQPSSEAPNQEPS